MHTWCRHEHGGDPPWGPLACFPLGCDSSMHRDTRIQNGVGNSPLNWESEVRLLTSSTKEVLRHPIYTSIYAHISASTDQSTAGSSLLCERHSAYPYWRCTEDGKPCPRGFINYEMGRCRDSPGTASRCVNVFTRSFCCQAHRWDVYSVIMSQRQATCNL